MTTLSQIFTGALPGSAGEAGQAPGPLARVNAVLAEFRCRLLGHQPELRIDTARVFLACPDCGNQSPGWVLDQQQPKPRFDGAPDRFQRYAWMTGR
ncbi:MAG TPA: hypothetical protein VF198_04745 [Vicinamibacterales bacterium]